MATVQHRTCGNWTDERPAQAHLVSIVNPLHWKVRERVSGYMLHPRLDVEGTCGKQLDVMLQPTSYLMECGWRWGFVGVECKKSETKLGRVISQAMDYTRCAWTIPPYGFDVMARFVFIWPCEPVGGDLQSVMVQHRIGVAYPRGKSNSQLWLWFNGTLAYADQGDKQPRIAKDLVGGNKQGSR